MAIIIFGQKFFGYHSIGSAASAGCDSCAASAGSAVSLGQDIKKWRIEPLRAHESDMGCTPGNKDAFMSTKTSKHSLRWSAMSCHELPIKVLPRNGTIYLSPEAFLTIYSSSLSLSVFSVLSRLSIYCIYYWPLLWGIKPLLQSDWVAANTSSNVLLMWAAIAQRIQIQLVFKLYIEFRHNLSVVNVGSLSGHRRVTVQPHHSAPHDRLGDQLLCDPASISVNKACIKYVRNESANVWLRLHRLHRTPD